MLSTLDVAAGTFSESTQTGLLTSLYALAILLPGLGVTVRRLHDMDHSGWWIMISFVPLVGGSSSSCSR